jgi:hypothetical protein
MPVSNYFSNVCELGDTQTCVGDIEWLPNNRMPISIGLTRFMDLFRIIVESNALVM